MWGKKRGVGEKITVCSKNYACSVKIITEGPSLMGKNDKEVKR